MINYSIPLLWTVLFNLLYFLSCIFERSERKKSSLKFSFLFLFLSFTGPSIEFNRVSRFSFPPSLFFFILFLFLFSSLIRFDQPVGRPNFRIFSVPATFLADFQAVQFFFFFFLFFSFFCFDSLVWEEWKIRQRNFHCLANWRWRALTDPRLINRRCALREKELRFFLFTRSFQSVSLWEVSMDWFFFFFCFDLNQLFKFALWEWSNSFHSSVSMRLERLRERDAILIFLLKYWNLTFINFGFWSVRTSL